MELTDPVFITIKEAAKRQAKVEYYMNNPMVHVTPGKNDEFSNEFVGEVVGTHEGLLTVRDGDENYFDVELDQITPEDPLDDYPQ
jgi:hypothetical protein